MAVESIMKVAAFELSLAWQWGGICQVDGTARPVLPASGRHRHAPKHGMGANPESCIERCLKSHLHVWKASLWLSRLHQILSRSPCYWLSLSKFRSPPLENNPWPSWIKEDSITHYPLPCLFLQAKVTWNTQAVSSYLLPAFCPADWRLPEGQTCVRDLYRLILCTCKIFNKCF